MICGNHPRRASEPVYQVERLHTLGSLEHYEAVTRRARKLLIEPAQVHQHAGPETTVLPKPDNTVPAMNDAELVYDTELITDGGSPYVLPEWLRLSLWACGIAVITFLLVIASILVAGVASVVL